MNVEILRRAFKTESATNTGTVLTLPSGLTKGMARSVAEKINFEPVLKALAVAMAQEVGGQLMANALRPADYADLRDIPDALVELFIEELAQKPDAFFDAFRQNLKIQG